MFSKFVLLFAVIGALAQAEQVNPQQVTVERGIKVTMRDGVVLRADIYRPTSEGRFPVLLQRTPYDKRSGAGFGYRAAANGYVVIFQDVRGRYTSDGEWYPFLHESADGYDTVEWAAALPYSNDKVGMFGGSYVGATQMLTAIARPPHLAGICPFDTASNYHSNWTYQGGAFEQWFNESWTSGLAQDTLNRKIQAATNALAGIEKLPLADYPLFNLKSSESLYSTEQLAPYFLDWLAHPNYDDFWQRWSIEDHYSDIQVPALHVSAWYDIFQGGSLRNYLGIRAHGGNEAARNGQHLLVAIGGHAGRGRKIGEVDFGPEAEKFSDDQIVLDWYDFLFKGQKNRFSGDPVEVFVMGRNQWRMETAWPPPNSHVERWFLHSSQSARSLHGDGLLSKESPKQESADRFTYDPANPVATIGGPLCCDGLHLPPGPRDQRPDESRDDVLVYTSSAFDKDTEMTGPVGVELFAESSAVDTDFTAKLIDVWPNGFAQNLTEGIVRARYRESADKPEMMNPRQIYKFSIDLWSTSNVFLSGHRLRVEISSSNFPRFDRNLNNGMRAGLPGAPISAVNSVYHDAAHPSAILLPVMSQP